MSTATREKRQVRRWTADLEILNRRFRKDLRRSMNEWRGYVKADEHGMCGLPYHAFERRVLLKKGGKP